MYCNGDKEHRTFVVTIRPYDLRKNIKTASILYTFNYVSLS